jgi:hypothetical protein
VQKELSSAKGVVVAAGITVFRNELCAHFLRYLAVKGVNFAKSSKDAALTPK